MEENVVMDGLKDKVDALGADTIMGAMSQTSKEEVLEKIDKLNEAVAEARGNKDIDDAIVGSSTPVIRGFLPRTRPIVRDIKKVHRNDPCPCGAVDENGKPKKYKNCCMDSGKYETTHFN